MSYCQWCLWVCCFSLSEERVSVVVAPCCLRCSGQRCYMVSTFFWETVAVRCNRIQTFRRNALASPSQTLKSWKNRDDAIGLPIEERRILKELNPCLRQWDSLESSLHGLNVFIARYQFTVFRNTTPSGSLRSCYHNPVKRSIA